MDLRQQLANLHQRIMQYLSAKPSSTVALSVTLGVVILCAYIQLVAPLTPLDVGWDAQPNSTLFFLLSIPLVTIWGASAYFRCSDARIRRSIYLITLLSLAWLLLTRVKYLVEDPTLNSFLWYLFYTPLLFIPTLMLFCALDAANLRALKHSDAWLARIKAIKHFSLTASSVLALAVATNNLHYLAFKPTLGLRPIGLHYTYGPIYFAVFAWIAVMALLFLAVLFVNARRRLRSILLFATGFCLLLACYSVMYVLRIPAITNLPFTAFMVLSYVAIMELCLRSGLLPRCANYERVFQHLPLDVKINSWDGRKTLATEKAAPAPETLFIQARRALQRQHEPAFFQSEDHLDTRYQAYTVPGGVAVATNDLSTVNARKRTLEQQREVLERQNNLLEQYRQAQIQLLQRHNETELYRYVETSLSESVEAIAHLLDNLAPQTAESTPAERSERHRQLMLVKLLVSYCKRKGGLVLIEQGNADFDRDRLNLIINETMTDLRPAGVDCAALIEIDEALPAVSSGLCIDALYAFALTAIECTGYLGGTSEGESESESESEGESEGESESESEDNPTLMLFLQNKDHSTTELRIAFEGGAALKTRTPLPLVTLRANLEKAPVNYQLERDGGSTLLVVRMPRRG